MVQEILVLELLVLFLVAVQVVSAVLLVVQEHLQEVEEDAVAERVAQVALVLFLVVLERHLQVEVAVAS
jgi:hypothetical protein